MKKVILFLCVCLCLSACISRKLPEEDPTLLPSTVESTEVTIPTEIPTVPEETTIPITTTVPVETTVPETTAPPPETTVAETFPSLPDEVTLEDLVTVIWDETLTWKSAGKEMVFTCPVPELLPFSEDAVRVNGEIQDYLWHIIDMAKEDMKYKQECGIVSAGYQTYLNADILSVMAWWETQYDLTHYEVWNLNLKTGKQPSELEIAELLGMSEEVYSQLLTDKVTGAFLERNQHWADTEWADIYLEQFDVCISQENLKKTKLFFGDDGEVMVLAPIYAMAGAGKYPTLIPLGLVYK